MAMEIVHVDPGYGRVMLSTSDTGTTFVENDEYNPTSGVAFTHAGDSAGVYARLPNLDFSFEPSGQFYKKVFSLKFTVYAPGSGSFRAGFSKVASGAPMFGGIDIRSNNYSIVRFVENVEKYSQNAGLSAGLHYVSITHSLTVDSTKEVPEYLRTTTIEVDNVVDFQTYTTTTKPNLPQYALFHFGGSSSHYYVSNVLVGQASYEGDGNDDIPSDDGIPANTPVYRLPLGAPEEIDFEAGEDGEYIAKENGKKLLQTVDTTNLISRFGNQPITHVVSYGNPGYRVGTAVTEATGLSKADGAGVPRGTHELSFVKDMHIYDIWKLTQHKSFAALNGIQVGWLSGGTGG